MNPSDTPPHPVNGKDYYVQLEIFTQGDEKNYSHYQYFFKVVKGEPLTDQSDYREEEQGFCYPV